MLIPLLLGMAVALGAPAPALGAAVLALWQPLWLLAGAVVWAAVAWRRRRRGGPGPSDEAGFLQGLAGELDAGASLRAAVASAATRVPSLGLARASRLAAAGAPAEQVGGALQEALQVNGRLAAAAFRLASATGGRVASLFGGLAARATEVGRLARERRALTAQARASAWVVGGAPAVLLGLLALTGRLGPLLSEPAGRVVLVVGLVLEAAGVAVVWSMVRGTGR